MGQKHILEGIIKWANRDPWHEMLEDVAGQHFGIACEEMGIEIDDLPDFIDNGNYASVWSCALEDLIATEIGGQNVADDYLKRRGWKESASARIHTGAPPLRHEPLRGQRHPPARGFLPARSHPGRRTRLGP